MSLVSSTKLLVAVAAALSTGLAAAGDASPTVVRVGELGVSAADVTRRLATTGPANATAPSGGLAGQRLRQQVEVANSAAPANASPRQFVESVIVPELLASLEARRRGLDKGAKYADREREILRQSLDSELKVQALAEKPITPQDIKTYFDENKSRFDQPLRIRLWRILLADEASAKAVLEQAKAAGSPAKWGELAREKSLDTATNLRQGDLGFVHPDGGTDTPRVRVDQALYRAAEPVKDGEFVAQPVKEGGKFAVVWRRGSLAEKSRTLEQERDSIRNLLERRRVDEARLALAQKLRAEFVKDERPELLEQLPEGMFGNKMAGRPRPTLAPRKPAPGLNLPRATDKGLR